MVKVKTGGKKMTVIRLEEKNNNHAAVSGERKMSETNADIDGDDTNSKSGILKVEKTLNHDGSIKKVRVFFTMEVVRKRRKKC